MQNTHIYEYLKYYFAFDKAPEYAVLLKGQWGVGKTWFINKALKELKENEGKYLYVSLYGVTSYDEIESEFFKQLHPLLSSKTFNFAGKIAKGLLKTTIRLDLDDNDKSETSITSQTPEINLPEYLTKTENYILVFDDLERCSMDIKNILGYINHFVEQQGYKVVIIGNESVIEKKFNNSKNPDSYSDIKEKLIGKTFEIQPNFESALSHFLEDIVTNDLKVFYQDNKESIKSLYDESRYKNLRHLKQALWDFERFYTFLSPEVTEKKDLILLLFKLYLCFSFEIKSGKMKTNELLNISSGFIANIWNTTNEESDSTYKQLSNKYNNVNFHEPLLEESIWFNIFDKGIIDPTPITESLLKSKFFQTENTENWVKLWHAIQLSDENFEIILKLVEDEFYSKKHSEVGVVKHLVGIFLWLSSIGLYEKSMDDILGFSKEYVDSLKEQNLLVPPDRRYGFIDRTSWGGLGFSAKETSQFNDFCEYLETKRNESILESYPDVATELLELIKTNPNKFYSKVVLNNHEDNEYYEIPILQFIEPSDFVAIFMESTTDTKETVCYALKQRYEFENFNSKLESELDWLIKINNLFINEQKKLNKKISGYYLRSFVLPTLKNAIEKLTKG